MSATNQAEPTSRNNWDTSPVNVDEMHHKLPSSLDTICSPDSQKQTTKDHTVSSHLKCVDTTYRNEYGSTLLSCWALFHAIFWLVLTGAGVLICALLIPFIGLTRAQRLTWRIACIYFRLCLWASRVSYNVVGLDNLDPAGHYFFACNHQSDFDIALAFAVTPSWLISVAKSSISYIPIFGWAVALGGTIFIQRSNHHKAVSSLEEGCQALRKRPRSVLLFPEGTRSEDGEVKQFKKGGLLLAIQSGLPVVPVAVCGARRVIGRALALRPLAASHCVLVFGKPVPTAGLSYEDRDDFCCEIQRQVAALKHAFESNPHTAATLGPARQVEPLWHCFLPCPPSDRPFWGRLPAATLRE